MVTGITTVQGGGFLAPGDTAGATHNTLTFSAASSTALTITDGGKLQIGITTPTLTSASFLNFFNGSNDAAAYLTANAGQLAVWNVAPTTITDHDYINLSGLGSNLSIGTGPNTVVITGTVSSPSIGMVFNLIDWAQAFTGVTPGTGMSGSFNAGAGFFSGGAFGDFSLPTLGAGFGWDTSAFKSYGIIVVVPEPGRALLMLLGLSALFFRRRRTSSL
jgi:hypothetical protein